MRPTVLFADLRDDPLRSPEVMWGMAMLIAALLVGAAVIYAVDRWRKRAAAAPTEADVTDELTGYRDMYDNGEITEAEYAELRRRVAEKVKAAAAAKPAPAPAPAGTMPPLPSLPPLQPGGRAAPTPPAPAPRPPEPPAAPGTA
jgi:hypothetical protein